LSRNGHHWEDQTSQESQPPFLMVAPSGVVEIESVGMSLEVKSRFYSWRDLDEVDQRRILEGSRASREMLEILLEDEPERFRCREEALLLGTPIEASGSFKMSANRGSIKVQDGIQAFGVRGLRLVSEESE